MLRDKPSINNLRNRDKKGGFLSIRSKMFIYFGLMFILVLTMFVSLDLYGIPFTNFRGLFKQKQSESLRNLNLVADLKKERMARWLEERRDDMRVLAESSIIRFYVYLLASVIHENTVNGVKENQLLSELQKKKDHQALMQHLRLVKRSYGVYDKIQIADALTGTIIASTHNKDMGMDVLQLDSNSRVFHPGYNEAVDIDKDPSSGALKLTISHTINHYVIDDKTLAVLIMQVNPDDFIKPMLHTGGGLGQTGEALLVNSEAKILSTPKHPLADGTMAIPLEYQLKDEPAILASRGEEGIIATRDYRGKKVLAAYRHIRITSELE